MRFMVVAKSIPDVFAVSRLGYRRAIAKWQSMGIWNMSISAKRNSVLVGQFENSKSGMAARAQRYKISSLNKSENSKLAKARIAIRLNKKGTKVLGIDFDLAYCIYKLQPNVSANIV